MTRDDEGARRLVRTARALLAKGGALQSSTSGERIEPARLRAVLGAPAPSTARSPGTPGVSEELLTRSAVSEVVSRVQSALEKTAGGAAPAVLDAAELDALQAIVLVTGRPALRYSGGRVQVPPSSLGENERWHVLVATARSKINRVSEAVGRIALERPGAPDDLLGTGWRLGPDLLVTNRHVAARLALDAAAAPEQWRLDPSRTGIVEFEATDAPRPSNRRPIAAIAYCAAEAAVDVAILRLTRGGAELPDPPALDLDPNAVGADVASDGSVSFQGEEVYVVGHPFSRRAAFAIGAVFGRADGLKRCSPGLVTRRAAGEPVFDHDCSTLGGNSGSCVLSVRGHAVVGVHVGGIDTDATTARADANRAVELARLDGQGHPVAAIVRAGHV